VFEPNAPRSPEGEPASSAGWVFGECWRVRSRLLVLCCAVSFLPPFRRLTGRGWAKPPAVRRAYLDYGRKLRMTISEGVSGHDVPFCITRRVYASGYVERTGYFLSRSDFAIPRPSVRRSSAALEEVGAERSPESVRASRASLRRLVYQLGPDRMLTLTYAENMVDFDQARADFKKFKDSFSKRFPHSSFVAVPEQQQRGAWHWHVVLRGWFNIAALRRWWPHGYARIDYKKRKLRDDADKLGLYLAKYVGKGLGLLGRAAYSVCNRKVLDKPQIDRVRVRLRADGALPVWVRLESLFKHGALAAFAFNGVYWRIDHVENSGSCLYSGLG